MPRPIRQKHRRDKAEPSEPRSPLVDWFLIPLAAFSFSFIVSPVLVHLDRASLVLGVGEMAVREENKYVWTALAALAVVVAGLRSSALSRLKLPAHIAWLIAYVALACLSVAWSVAPEITVVRSMQQVLVVLAIVLPAMLASRQTDLLRSAFPVLAAAAILNAIFVATQEPEVPLGGSPGYPGYLGKNVLGQFIAAIFCLALYEMRFAGARKFLGAVVAAAAAYVLIACNSKASLGLAVVIPILTTLVLAITRSSRISPAIILFSIPLAYIFLSMTMGLTVSRLAYYLFGDPTFTGRTVIWDYAGNEIASRPILGWGYRTFWLIGSTGQSVTNAPGWVKSMPHAHNGYLDSMLELGYAGYVILLGIIATTLHGIGRLAQSNPDRAWVLLALTLTVCVMNFFESTWVRGFDPLWVVFLIVAADLARQAQLPVAVPVTNAEPAQGPQGKRPARRPLAARPKARRPLQARGMLERDDADGVKGGRPEPA